MRTIADETMFQAFQPENRPVIRQDREKAIRGVDGITEYVELDVNGFTGALGRLVRFDNDGPGICPANDNTASGKAARAWPAMQRANANTLMPTTFENLEAQAVLRRGRHVFDVATVGHDIAPNASETAEAVARQNALRNVKIDRKAIDIWGVESDLRGFQTDYRVKFGPKGAPSLEKIAAMTPDEYRTKLERMPMLHEQRFTTPRGTDDKRPRAIRYHASITLSGKTKCKTGAASFDPAFDDVPQHTMLEAQDELRLLRELMTPSLFDVFNAIAFSNATSAEVGELAGSKGKRAQAIGLERTRATVTAAIAAFAEIDRRNDVAIAA